MLIVKKITIFFLLKAMAFEYKRHWTIFGAYKNSWLFLDRWLSINTWSQWNSQKMHNCVLCMKLRKPLHCTNWQKVLTFYPLKFLKIQCQNQHFFIFCKTVPCPNKADFFLKFKHCMQLRSQYLGFSTSLPPPKTEMSKTCNAKSKSESNLCPIIPVDEDFFGCVLM